MPKKDSEKVELLQGTLDMLVLRALSLGPLHGHAIAIHIERTSDDVLRVDHGSLYPALHRLKKRGWITGSWERMPDRNRHAKYYRLTAAGKKRLVSEHSNGAGSRARSAESCSRPDMAILPWNRWETADAEDAREIVRGRP